MMRWAVDVGGIDIDADLDREQNKVVYVAPQSKHQEPWRGMDEWKPEAATDDDVIGDVWVLSREEMRLGNRQRVSMAERVFGPLKEPTPPPSPLPPSPAVLPSISWSAEGGASDGGATTGAGDSESNPMSASPHSGTMESSGRHSNGNPLEGSLSSPPDEDEADFMETSPGREVRVFSSLLNAQGKTTAVTVQMQQPTFRGVDVVSAFLQKYIAPSEALCERFSTNPRLYKLFIADEFTGEEEMAVQIDLAAQNFSCYAISPLPMAKLYLFPQHTQLLPTTAHDINLTVNVRPLTAMASPVQRQCVVPGDILAETLESVISRRLPASAIVQGSLRIMYGPLELNINECYNFGAGCGQMNCPIAEVTVLSLFRFGVKEVVVNGKGAEEAPTEVLRDIAEDIAIDMDVEEAISFQQFEVICINKYGARQQRLLCVDGEHLYTMRPNASEAMPKTTERSVRDIEEVRTYPDKPKYLEIVYNKTSKFEEDHIECTTVYNCALLDEKIRVVRRELRKQDAENEEKNKPETVMQRLADRFRSKWRWGGSD